MAGKTLRGQIVKGQHPSAGVGETKELRVYPEAPGWGKRDPEEFQEMMQLLILCVSLTGPQGPQIFNQTYPGCVRVLLGEIKI